MPKSIGVYITCSRVRLVTLLVSLLASGGLAGVAWSDETRELRDVAICNPDLVALGGYDAVSYHQETGPVVGQEAFSTQQGTLTYRFASAENQRLFADSPQKYTPTYMGWCSTNLAMGRLACPDFSNYKIENGRLLLFEHVGFTNGRDIWNSDPAAHKKRADDNFAQFLDSQ